MTQRRWLMAAAIFAIAFPLSAGAQDDAIDLFDNQDSMAAGQVAIEGDASAVALDELGIDASVPDGAVQLKFERSDSSILVETKIQGQDAYLIFDTGASITSLNTGFVQKIGKLPPPDAPTARVSTANGQTMVRFGLLDNLTLGDRIHSGVSFMTCDACPFGMRNGRPIVGLLGLNVLNRYRYSIDESTGTIELQAISNFSNRMRDVQPWLRIAGGRGEPAPKLKTQVSFEVQNLARRTVREVVFRVDCSSGESVTLKPISVRSRAKKSVEEIVDIEECGQANIQPVAANW